ncbi:hypothetical protein [Pseudoduganella sp. GCM10020061]|uniref:hypothetical protein n=1 Tax=Pseudoduganella sp. GCM10020061 TaxID=3317345 RepID=UPI0036302ECB
MKILIACFSRTGHTARLAAVLSDRLAARGHELAFEAITPHERPSRWRLVPPLWPAIPLLPLILWAPPFRNWWFKRYPQPEQALAPLAWPDASGFDAVCVGGPKWLYIAYPVARYLNTVQGLAGKPVASFATFCGPPLDVFEMQMLFTPIRHRIAAREARHAGSLAVSSGFHEFFFFNEMEYLFRAISRMVFGRSLSSFGIGSAWAEAQIERFCDELEAAHGTETVPTRGPSPDL